MASVACTFSATPGPLYPTYEKITSQSGCCVTDSSGTVTSAYGLNNTCHLLHYTGEAAPYSLTLLDRNAGNLSLTTGECVGLVMNVDNKGEYSTGNGTGPSDAGLASKYGYHGCVVGASSDPNTASSDKTSAASLRVQNFFNVKGICLLATLTILLWT